MPIFEKVRKVRYSFLFMYSIFFKTLFFLSLSAYLFYRHLTTSI